jgi:asparagine synthase (glutamine-hydrolysing)
MCGVCGIFRGAGREGAGFGDLDTMAAALRHRGPDNTSTHVAGRIGIAHTRLALLDLSDRGNQPFRDDRYSLVYNGEIYNFSELRHELESEHRIAFTSGTDTEVLFHSLRRHGVRRTLERIRGMFAFAFVDHVEQRIVLARDRVGIKPLFYGVFGGDLYFASELKALHSVLDLSPDKFAVTQAVFHHLERSRNMTAFAGVKQLEPGSYMEIDSSGRIATEHYFRTVDLVDRDLYRELDETPDDRVLDLFAERFDASVRSMMIADAPVGAFVSGGVDSSLIAASAKKAGKNPRLFSVNVVGKHSEIDAARRLASHLGAPLEVYTFEPRDFLRDWVKTTWFYENPIIVNQHALPFGNLAAVARRGGDKAELTGEGADELFIGYWIDARRSWIEPILHAPLEWLTRRLTSRGWSTLRAKQARERETVALRDMLWLQDESERERSYAAAFDFLPDARARAQHTISLRLIDTTLQALLWRNDRMGMMHSIESRFPFLDESILAFAASLPVRFKVRWSLRRGDRAHPFLIDKYLVRKLADRFLPRDLARRKKRAFPIHGLSELAVSGELFADGVWQELAGLRTDQCRRFPETVSPPLLAKMASVEVWGRLYARREPIQDVQALVERSCTLRVGS